MSNVASVPSARQIAAYIYFVKIFEISHKNHVSNGAVLELDISSFNTLGILF